MKIHYITICRHGILFFFMTSNLLFSFIPLGIFIWISFVYKTRFPHEFSNYVILPILLILVNAIFLQLILKSINFFGRIILITDHAIIFIHTSLILVDDIEFMDMKSILKVDVERHGLLANVLNYGHLILEQRNEVRRVHYIPYPHSVYQEIKERIPKKNEIGSI